MRKTSVTCRLLAVGNELLLGEVVDTNTAFMARRLTENGVTVSAKETLPDTLSAIVRAVRSAREDIILLCGGLGPTPDDLTRHALARAFSSTCTLDARQLERIAGFFSRIGRPMAACNRVQAMIPGGFAAVDNPHGTAPALFRKKPFIFALPGVPRELEALMKESVLPEIRKAFCLPVLHIEEVRTLGIGESTLFEKIEDIKIPKGVTFASLPELGAVVLRLWGPDRKAVSSVARKIAMRVRPHVYGHRGDTLESVIQARFIRANRTLALAESCTGGRVASRLTAVPESSRYFLGGVVAYSNALKMKFLGVKAATLKKHGAVSAECAREMAEGARQRMGADVAASVTGIAGPDGGTDAKPVGTVFMACASRKGTEVQSLNLWGSRKAVQERSVSAVLGMLHKAAL
ncbi:MAG: CinA family nicotinamide mononucleotide deamidase-related protein [Fibrobacterota bacterium]